MGKNKVLPGYASTDKIGMSVADNVTAMLSYWDSDLICRYANRALERWFRKTKEELIDRIELETLLGPLFKLSLPYIQGVLKGEAQTFERELTTPEGALLHAITNYIPDILDGQVKGFYVQVVDVTKIKQLELELQLSNTLISQQNQRLLSFSYIVSHNLKSYARNLDGILTFLIKAEDEEKRGKLMELLIDISKGFNTPVDNLNELVTMQANNTGTPSSEINLLDCIQNALKAVRVDIERTNATVTIDVGEEITLTANAATIDSILLNMLTNAIKYRHPERQPEIMISAIVASGEIVISVSDNGLGLDLTKHGKDLFGIFKTFHGNSDASGMGLFLTRFQIEQMGGRIEVHSEVDKGAKFVVYLKQ